jgi:predicted nucleic acid-binding protein
VLVLDASVAIAACAEADGFARLGDAALAAPSLMWSETRSRLRLSVHHGEATAQDGDILHERLERCPVQRLHPEELGPEAWRLAQRLGWGRTYDAEYVALARLLDCRLVTLDLRLRRGAGDVVDVVTPGEL